MNKFLSKPKFQFLTILLCIFMAIFFLSSYAISPKIAFAEDEEPVIYYEPYELAPYLSNNEVTEDEIDGWAEQYVEPYKEALYFDDDGELLIFEPWLVEEGPYHYEIIETINTHVSIMNELVEEDLGYIDEDYTFQPTTRENLAARLRAYNFTLKWNKLSIRFDRELSIDASLCFLASRIFFDCLRIDVENVVELISTEEYLTKLLNEVINDIKGEVNSKIASTLSTLRGEPEKAEMLSMLSLVEDVSKAPTLFLKAISIISAFFLPSILDSTIVLFSSLLFDYESTLTSCWIPIRKKDSFGASLNVVEWYN